MGLLKVVKLQLDKYLPAHHWISCILALSHLCFPKMYHVEDVAVIENGVNLEDLSPESIPNDNKECIFSTCGVKCYRVEGMTGKAQKVGARMRKPGLERTNSQIQSSSMEWGRPSFLVVRNFHILSS